MTELKILSMNVNGFSNRSKREMVIQTVERKKVDIMVLCDTRFRASEHTSIENELAEYCVFFASKNFNPEEPEFKKRGVAILINKNSNIRAEEIYQDPGGNFLIVRVKINNKIIHLCALYAISEDESVWYESVFNKIFEKTNGNLVVVGDFNCPLNHSLDTQNYLTIPNSNSRTAMIKIIEENQLVDIYRDLNGEKPLFTWQKWDHYYESFLHTFYYTYYILYTS